MTADLTLFVIAAISACFVISGTRDLHPVRRWNEWRWRRRFMDRDWREW
jgi:hypothetical protein